MGLGMGGIRKKDIIKVHLHPAKCEELHNHAARESMLGTRSNVRPNHEDRLDKLVQDGDCGIFAQYAAIMVWFGSDERFYRAREEQSRNIYKGDGGKDVHGLNLDVKSRHMTSMGMLTVFDLIVPPEVRHADNIYVHCVVYGWEQWKNDGVDVFVIGWIADEALPPAVTDDIVVNKHRVSVSKLEKVPPFRWDYFIETSELKGLINVEQLNGR